MVVVAVDSWSAGTRVRYCGGGGLCLCNVMLACTTSRQPLNRCHICGGNHAEVNVVVRFLFLAGAPRGYSAEWFLRWSRGSGSVEGAEDTPRVFSGTSCGIHCKFRVGPCGRGARVLVSHLS